MLSIIKANINENAKAKDIVTNIPMTGFIHIPFIASRTLRAPLRPPGKD
jgi:hypothetical protein